MKWAILDLPYSITFLTEDYFKTHRPEEFQRVLLMQADFKRYQKEVYLPEKCTKILEKYKIKFKHPFGKNRLRALNGKYHWFKGNQKYNAFELDQETERQLKEEGHFEIKFERTESYSDKQPQFEVDKIVQRILFIVSCTRDKIWNRFNNFSDYCPACFAYIGNVMQIWSLLKESQKYPWIIFSSKYGFLDYDHPIRRYDINFVEKEESVVSPETLEHQIFHHFFKSPTEGIQIQIKDFDKIFFIGSSDYYTQLSKIFRKSGLSFESYHKFSSLYGDDAKTKIEAIRDSVNFIAEFICEKSLPFEEIKHTLPEREGVYAIMRDTEVIYVGSSKNLKNRVTTHFTESGRSVLRNKLFQELGNNGKVDEILRICEIKIFLSERYSPLSTKMFEHLLIAFFEPKYNS